MLNISQFREYIVKSTLNDLLLYSPEAEELLVFTCANESNGGTYLRQVGGPALGIFQMEPETYTDIWHNFIKPNGSLILKLSTNFDINGIPQPERMIYDLRFATAMARLFYLRINAKLPESNDINSIWSYYKQYYNTIHGKAVQLEAIEKYHTFLVPY